MSYAAILIPDFSLHALCRAEVGLAQKPVGLSHGTGRQATLTEVSAQTGLSTGLNVTLALARCPGLIVRSRNLPAETEAQRILLAAAFTLSPRVESTAPGCATIDLQGTGRPSTEAALHLRLAELGALGLPAHAGIAASPLMAFYAARHTDSMHWVEDLSSFLRDLPLDAADPTPAQLEVLTGWGIRTLGQLTALTKSDVGLRLGTAGAALWERAAGETTRPLRLVSPPQTFVAEWVYEPPIEQLEPLTFKLQRYAERIAAELRAAGFVAEALRLSLQLEDESEHGREFRLPEPSADVASWLRVVLTHLETVRLAFRLQRVRLVAQPARPTQRQDGLFDTGLRDPAAFWENLARLEALLGPDRVGTPITNDTHRPDAFTLGRPIETVTVAEPAPLHPTRGLVLRRFRPAWSVAVTLSAASPTFITGTLTGPVTHSAGPWLTAGDWWKPEAWTLETWQVEIDQAIYQLSRTAAGWFVEGVFD